MKRETPPPVPKRGDKPDQAQQAQAGAHQTLKERMAALERAKQASSTTKVQAPVLHTTPEQAAAKAKAAQALAGFIGAGAGAGARASSPASSVSSSSSSSSSPKAKKTQPEVSEEPTGQLSKDALEVFVNLLLNSTPKNNPAFAELEKAKKMLKVNLDVAVLIINREAQALKDQSSDQKRRP